MRTPTAAPLPPTAPQMPSALFRSAPSAKSVVTMESARRRDDRGAEALDARAKRSGPLAFARPQTSEAA
jgi:hypothetical protein